MGARRDWILIVAGLPRSGTSLMMRMLEAGGVPVLTDPARAPDEGNPRGYYELQAVKKTESDASWVPRARGKAVKVVSRLLGQLPPEETYRVLLMQRRLPEVHASQEAMLEALGRSESAMELGEFETLFGGEIRRTLDWLQTQPNFSALVVDYNALLCEPRPELIRIDGFLGGGLDLGAMERAIEPALYRRRA